MGKEEMWIAFEVWIYTRKDSSRPHIPWLHKPLDGVPRRVSLLSEWLGMEETREKWGWEECPTCWKPGRFRAELAKEAK